MIGGGFDPEQMEQMMKQFGIDMDDIAAERIVIETEDGGELVFNEPNVTVMNAPQGEEVYQIIGEPDETTGVEDEDEPEEVESVDEDNGIPDEDVKLVAQQADASMSDARAALEDCDGDLADAVDQLK